MDATPQKTKPKKSSTRERLRKRGRSRPSPQELADSDMSADIAMLRLVMQRVLDYAAQDSLDGEHPGSGKRWLEALSALSKATGQIARILKLQQEITGKQDSAAHTLSQAINELMDGWGWESKT
jgi:hypothetical protein